MRPRAFLLILIAALALRLLESAWPLPVREIALADRIGPETARQVGALREDPAVCQAKLRDAGQRFTIAPAVSEGEFCGYSNALTIGGGGGLAFRPVITASCPVIAGLFLWDKQVLQPAAERFYGQRVVAIEGLGTYACRRVGGAETGRVSEHASANAIDISAIRLADGRRISIVDDWGSADGEFLRALRDGACLTFATVLSPDYDEAHRDHLHFDQAPRRWSGLCR